MTQYITLNKRAKDITGQRFGRLVALGPVDRTKHNKIIWLCRCDCGNTTSLALGTLTSGHTRSCGCFSREITARRNRTHGMKDDPLYGTWKNIITRCTNTRTRAYQFYGARGIRICDEWRNSFETFHAYVTRLPGYGKKGYTLDRINNNGNYEPDNVRWASLIQQRQNTRSNHLLTFDGKTRCITEWEREIGMRPGTLKARIANGWTVERALTTPVATDLGGHSSRIE